MIRHHTVRLARGAIRAASRAARTAAQRLGAIWAAHSRLLRENAAYAATVGAAAAAAATQHGWRDVLAVIISAAVAVWTAIRTGHRHYPEPGLTPRPPGGLAMTDTTTPRETFQASFTAEELDHLRGELTRDATQGFLKVWDLLLAKAGEPPHTQIPGRTIRPDAYSIPFEQAKSLVQAIEPGNVELHFAWVLAWLNYGPAWHTD